MDEFSRMEVGYSKEAADALVSVKSEPPHLSGFVAPPALIHDHMDTAVEYPTMVTLKKTKSEHSTTPGT
jgi:hypothetical protein